MKKNLLFLLWLFIGFFSLTATAQNPAPKKKKTEIYFSWGYNTEWYTRGRLHIDQPSLGNKYVINQFRAHDHRGWDEGLFSKALTIPQYNYRLGFFLKNNPSLGFEINFDHTKYLITDAQYVHLKGTYENRKIDSMAFFANSNGSYYYLNNGANFLLFNVVKRAQKYINPKGTVKIDLLGKAGIGPLVPHVENSFFGKANKPHFQLGGWNIGTEGAVRATFFQHVYLEFSGKLDYARYSGLKIYEGKARQAFGTAELILSMGLTF